VERGCPLPTGDVWRNSAYQTNIVQVNRACRPVSKPVDYNVHCYNKGKWKVEI